jgi:hypothetical protein
MHEALGLMPSVERKSKMNLNEYLNSFTSKANQVFQMVISSFTQND